MNFNNSQNNAKEQNNVNTRGLQWMNKGGFDPSTILIGYWNEMVSIKIHPALEKSKQTESKVFDYEKVVSTALTLDKITTLISKIEKDILPAIEKDENANVGVPVGADSLLVVGTGKKITGSMRPYVAIHKALDEKSKKPEMSIYYEFNRAYSVDNYEAETGAFNVTQNIHNEFMLFVEILKSARAALSNAIAHSMRTVDKYYKDRVLNTVNEIAGKMGISTGTGTGRGGYTKKNDLFSSASGDADGDLGGFSEPQNVQSLNNIKEIDEFLN